MPARLVYAPNVYVFTKNQNGDILNLSDYVVSGQVQRLINQASTANVTLRNPMKKFTIPSQGVAFHPMDPITIFLERIQGFPVQAFTGFLDDTPYYQMYPGAITLKATCTLKRLIYTYWDPSLPYVNAFMIKWGWINDNGMLLNLPSISGGAGNTATLAAGGQAGATANATATNPTTGGATSGALSGVTSGGTTGTGGTTATGGAAAGTTAGAGGTTTSKTAGSTTPATGQLQDGSIGKLLWAILTDVAQWQDSSIWIEELPSGVNGIAARMSQLISQLATDDQQGATEFNTFMQSVIGAGSQGTGGGPGGGATATGTALGSGAKWQVTASQESLGGSGSCGGSIQANGYSELSTNPGAGASGCDFHALGNIPCGTVLNITNPANGRTVQAAKQDIGCGSSFNPVMGLYPGTSGALGLSGGQYTVIISRVDGQNISPAHGTPVGGTTSGGATTGTATGGATGGATLGTTSGGTGNLATGGATTGATTAGTTTSGGLGAVGSQGTTTGAPASGTGGTTRIQAMLNAAQSISNQHLPYVWGGGHGSAGQPSGGGYDCSGSVAAVLAAAGYWQPGSGVPADNGVISQLQSQGLISPGAGSGTPECTLYDNPGVHIWMTLNGRPFGTWAGASSKAGGGGWLSDSNPSGFQAFHLNPQTLLTPATGKPPAGGGGVGSGSAGGTTAAAPPVPAGEIAFNAAVNFPTFQDMADSILLGNMHRGFMHDQQLLQFVQELTTASLRSFMSLPNGDFFAFYPDYFGETNHRKAYWNVDDIEILEGGINLTDGSLVTHSYAVGDNTYTYLGGAANSGLSSQEINMLFSTGAIDVYNAFLDGSLVTSSSSGGKASQQANQTGGMADVMTTAEATEFVKRYGARPMVQQYPQVRSPLYEMFLAYQNFMLAWANQFRTPFTFTFMPEVFPGGKIAFPNHGLQMYVSSVTHSFDFQSGFTTQAQLTAPSALPGTTNPDLPPDMVQALVEPIRALAAQLQTSTKGATTSGQTATTTNTNSTGLGVKGNANAAPGSSSSSSTTPAATGSTPSGKPITGFF